MTVGLARLLAQQTSSLDESGPMPPPSPPREEPAELCVGMATYEDFDGVYFTVQSLRLHHPEVARRIELVVVDNHPFGATAAALARLAEQVPNLRYVPFPDRCSTAVRDVVFRETEAPWVLVLDSHVLLEGGALASLLAHYDAHPETDDLIQGPLVMDDLGSGLHTHMEPRWRAGMFGAWAQDERAAERGNEAFEIPMHGLGLFSCRRAAWPGLHPDFVGFGGEEGYLHERFRQRGGRTVCLPALRWLHRFHRPNGAPYPLAWRDRFLNYHAGFEEVGWDTEPIREHFRELVGAEPVAQWLAIREAGRRSALRRIDAAYFRHDPEDPGSWIRARNFFEREGSSHRLVRVARPGRDAGRRAELQQLRELVERCRARRARRVLLFDRPELLEEPEGRRLLEAAAGVGPNRPVVLATDGSALLLSESAFSAALEALSEESGSEEAASSAGGAAPALEELARRVEDRRGAGVAGGAD